MYEISFWGAAVVRAYRIPRHRRNHRSFEAAAAEARRVLSLLDMCGVRAAHPAIVNGPGLGQDGRSIR